MTFEEWLKKQPFGGPSRVPGKSLLAESTINLMRKAWDAALEQPVSIPAGIYEAEVRLRGDISE